MTAARMTTLRLLGTASAAVIFMSCSQQQDNASVVPPAGSIVTGNRQSDLQPGTPATDRQAKNPFERNETAIAEGKQLYNHFNCSGCHAAGGGAIGPPLMAMSGSTAIVPRISFGRSSKGVPKACRHTEVESRPMKCGGLRHTSGRYLTSTKRRAIKRRKRSEWGLPSRDGVIVRPACGVRRARGRACCISITRIRTFHEGAA